MKGLDLAFDSYTAALAALEAAGYDFAEIDTAALLAKEIGLGTMAGQLLAATVAEQAMGAIAIGTPVDVAVKEAFAAANKQIAAAFDTNLRVAYGAGRYERGMAAKTLPYMTFSTMRDSKVRPTHQALNGVTLPKDHEFWKTHICPLDWRCRCRTYAVNAQQVQDLGREVSDTPPEEAVREYTNPTTGETLKVPVSTSPGWLFNGQSPAIDPKGALQALLDRKMAELVAAAP